MANPFRKLLQNKQRTSPEYAARVRKDLDRLPELSAKLELLRHNRQFRVDQQKPEFLQLLERIRSRGCREILELGGRRGGSTMLLSLAGGDEARVLSIDINNRGVRIKSLTRFVQGRNIRFWQGDSHARETFERVEQYLEGSRFEAIFIDGDHSYDGVRQDFLSYSRLIGDQGMIAIHDIQEDYQTRFGVETNSWTGGVPRFWKELTAAGFAVEELISDPYQDGYGIGVVYWDASAAERFLEQLLRNPS